MIAEVQYADAGGVSVAYRVLGDGGSERDLVMVSGGFFAMEQLLEDRVARRLIDGVASLGRLVIFDRRGIGLSDPLVDWSRALRLQWAEDLVAVVAAAGLSAPVCVAWDGFYGIGRAAAAGHPGALAALVLINPLSYLDPTVWGKAEMDIEEAFDLERAVFPSRIDEPGFREWLERAGRLGASPGVAAKLWEAADTAGESLTPPGIETPTLVLHRAQCRWPEDRVRSVAEAIPGAEFVQVDGLDVSPVSGDVDPLLAEISRFVTGAATVPRPETVTAAVLFTDLVASTDQAAGVGDRRWRSMLDRHDTFVSDCVERGGGRVIKFTGDGALALFPSVHGALVTSRTIERGLEGQGLTIRSGIHLGDVHVRGADVSGMTVNVAARIMGFAGAGETLTSDAVFLATIGSEHQFEERETLTLKGVPHEWKLWRLLEAPDAADEGRRSTRPSKT